MTELARIARHPTDRDVVLIHTPPGLQNEFGRFGPARYSSEHRAYLLHNDHIPAFYRFARTISLHVIDERAKAGTGARTLPVECSNCQQGGSLGRPPKVCPACGETWVPTTPPISEEAKGRVECAECKHRQSGRFPYCGNCGARMSYAPGSTRPPAPVLGLDERRSRLTDPVALRDTLDRLGSRMPDPKPPRAPREVRGRPVETVDLLGEPHDEEPPGW